MNVLLRRRKLGKGSCNGIAGFMETPIKVVCHDLHKMPEGVTKVIRWGCTANVNAGQIINKAKGIHQVADKKDFRLLLDDHDLCPRTWGSITEFKQDPTAQLWPLVVRKARHAQGRNIHLCNNMDELEIACRKYDNYYIAEYIDKVAEYRVAVVSGRAVWVAQKTPANKNDLAWNVAKGGRFDNVRWSDWPLKAVRIAIEAYNLTDLTFGGVDVMIDKDGEVYVLEINSAPSQTSPYRQSCMAKAFDYILEKGDERIPLVDDKGKYLKFIHPALDNKALMKG